MQMMMDELIEGFDIFKALNDSKSEGIEIGVEEGIKTNAINMLKLNMSTETIIQCTGLSIEELEELRKSL